MRRVCGSRLVSMVIGRHMVMLVLGIWSLGQRQRRPIIIWVYLLMIQDNLLDFEKETNCLDLGKGCIKIICQVLPY